MKTFEIYFSDLNEDAQDRLLKAVGAESPVEMNWDMDICPIAMYDFEEDSSCSNCQEFDCYGCEHKEKQE